MGNVLSSFLFIEMFSVKSVGALGNYRNSLASVCSQVNLVHVLFTKAMLG